MYAVIEDSGQQFRVSQGDVLDVDLRDLADDAKEVTFDRVLLVSDEDDVKIGTPLVTGAKVVAEVVDPEFKGKKVYIHRLRRRKASRTKTGHRQKYLRVRITSIDA
ncbi:MAG: 50S ribosomal protein L21 [Phycisphaerae bacterium]|jgi:large subunit ribosomal protein L21|nr:50S ribosomal protein L21 [Phycisphaerae bacterium]|tara:strand:+ start:187 stop:504 length:318 start_codon:yes stop_codon:yes gene_type:complete